MRELREIAKRANEIMIEDKKLGRMSAMVRAIQESNELICDDQYDEIEELMCEYWKIALDKLKSQCIIQEVNNTTKEKKMNSQEIKKAVDGILAISQLTQSERGKVSHELMKKLGCRIGFYIVKRAAENTNSIKAGFWLFYFFSSLGVDKMEIIILVGLVACGMLWGFMGWVIVAWLGREAIEAIHNIWSK